MWCTYCEWRGLLALFLLYCELFSDNELFSDCELCDTRTLEKLKTLPDTASLLHPMWCTHFVWRAPLALFLLYRKLFSDHELHEACTRILNPPPSLGLNPMGSSYPPLLPPGLARPNWARSDLQALYIPSSGSKITSIPGTKKFLILSGSKIVLIPGTKAFLILAQLYFWTGLLFII